MSKETHYFSHDYHARADRKLVNIIKELGMEGIGIFWCIVEMLYEEGGTLPIEYDSLAFALRTDAEKVKRIINGFELFQVNCDHFFSVTAQERLKLRIEKSEKAKESAYARWNKPAV